jgi:hypothetical protein
LARAADGRLKLKLETLIFDDAGPDNISSSSTTSSSTSTSTNTDPEGKEKKSTIL